MRRRWLPLTSIKTCPKAISAALSYVPTSSHVVPVRPFFLRLVAVLCFGALAVSASVEVHAQATPTCAPILSAADERYIQREFNEAEALARACLAQAQLSREEAAQAYRLLALIALRQDDFSGAETAVAQLLTVAPEYAPDSVQDPPSYVDLIVVVKERILTDPAFPPEDLVRATLRPFGPAEPPVAIVQPDPVDEVEPVVAAQPPAPERRGITRWLLVGGGVVVTGLVAVLLASGGSSSSPSGGTPLPPPPPFPR